MLFLIYSALIAAAAIDCIILSIYGCWLTSIYSHADNTLAPHEQMYWKWRDTTTRPKKKKGFCTYIPYSTISSSVITRNIFHRFTHLANEKGLHFFGSDCCTSVGAFWAYNTYWLWSCQAPIDVLWRPWRQSQTWSQILHQRKKSLNPRPNKKKKKSGV